MNFRLMIEVAMLLAALGLGAHAIRTWRAQGIPVREGLGLTWDRQAGRDLLAGLAITSLAMLGIFAVERLLGGITRHDADGAGLLGKYLLGMSLATFKEEFLMRSLLLGGLVLVLRGRAALAVAISAVAFGLIHLSNPGATVLSVTGNALGGVIYGMAFVLTGRLWLPLGLHFAWNFTQGPVLGFPVSGMEAGGLQRIADSGPAWLTGAGYGPEAGLVGIAFRFVIMAAVLAWCARMRPARA